MNCSGSGSYSSILAGIDWVMTNRQGPAVANFSIGGPASSTLNSAVRNLIASGVQVGLAAGNSGADACQTSPASTAEGLTVGASTSADAKPSYSNWGSCVDVFAPGSSVKSAWYSTTTASGSMSGTSMAAPHVTGVLALLLDEDPARTPAALHTWITSSSARNVITGAQSANNHLLQVPSGSSGGGGGGGGGNAAPTATFTSSCDALTCSFDASGSSDADGSIASWAWTFGDGANGSGVTTSHVYAGSGSYTVTLTVHDNQGASASKTATVSATAPVQTSPVAEFLVSCSGSTCSFTDRSTATGASLTTWMWRFGDGATSGERNPSHRYVAPGTYQVRLDVIDSNGLSGSTVRSVTIAPPAGIVLEASAVKAKRTSSVELRWTGATGTAVDLFRNGVLLVRTANDGSHPDTSASKGPHTYRVCESGRSVCSPDATVRVR
jgi:PKD repeat protein